LTEQANEPTWMRQVAHILGNAPQAPGEPEPAPPVLAVRWVGLLLRNWQDGSYEEPNWPSYKRKPLSTDTKQLAMYEWEYPNGMKSLVLLVGVLIFADAYTDSVMYEHPFQEPLILEKDEAIRIWAKGV
jgi:hypothetical protein